MVKVVPFKSDTSDLAAADPIFYTASSWHWLVFLSQHLVIPVVNCNFV